MKKLMFRAYRALRGGALAVDLTPLNDRAMFALEKLLLRDFHALEPYRQEFPRKVAKTEVRLAEALELVRLEFNRREQDWWEANKPTQLYEDIADYNWHFVDDPYDVL